MFVINSREMDREIDRSRKIVIPRQRRDTMRTVFILKEKEKV